MSMHINNILKTILLIFSVKSLHFLFPGGGKLNRFKTTTDSMLFECYRAMQLIRMLAI